jgi:lysophospholipase L1-like esterase
LKGKEMRRTFGTAVIGIFGAVLWAQGAAVQAPQRTPGPTQQQVDALEKKLADWPQLNYYRDANAKLAAATAGEDRVVFYGASIVEFWRTRGAFFPGKPYLDRGISGQTTAQMLLRFRQDVIELHPRAVVILGGSNDIAGNTGPMTLEMTEANWQSMAELARSNGIAVIFASLPPSTDFPWKRGLKPAEKIRTLNAWLKDYCAGHGATYLDVYTVLTNDEGGMKDGLSLDGVHPNAKGYALMEPPTQAAIDKALGKGPQ